MPESMRDFFDDEAPAAGATAPRFPSPPDDREQRVLRLLGGPPYLLGEATMAEWIEKYGALAVLAADEKLRRTEDGGSVIGRKVAYLEAILQDTHQQRRGRKTQMAPRHQVGEPRMREIIGNDVLAANDVKVPKKPKDRPETRREQEHRLRVRRWRERHPKIKEVTIYADAALRGDRLARRIASMEEGPDRDALVAEWRELP